MKEPPISSLGFDPILSMPTIEDFSASILKRSCPIKALLLDQSFSAGVGNWIAGTQVTHTIHILVSVLTPGQTKYFIMLESTPSTVAIRSVKAK